MLAHTGVNLTDRNLSSSDITDYPRLSIDHSDTPPLALYLGPLRAPEGCFRGFLQARDLNLAVTRMFIIGSVFRMGDLPHCIRFLVP